MAKYAYINCILFLPAQALVLSVIVLTDPGNSIVGDVLFLMSMLNVYSVSGLRPSHSNELVLTDLWSPVLAL